MNGLFTNKWQEWSYIRVFIPNYLNSKKPEYMKIGVIYGLSYYMRLFTKFYIFVIVVHFAQEFPLKNSLNIGREP